ncbi:MAG: type III secretion system ATPase SctN [Candidatus Competibacteraceae bacterium]|jgi:type III secretion protein N (ATPase)|nr:type III secretion system ATPase SctN [Candidatus Competibacteraceae bacterium]
MPFNTITTRLRDAVNEAPLMALQGRVIQVTGTVIKATVPQARIGELCMLHSPGALIPLLAEVIGFEHQVALLTAMGDMAGVSAGTAVETTGMTHQVPVGPELRGRVLDGLGQPLDTREPKLTAAETYPVYADPPAPLSRRMIDTPLALGIKAIDALTTCGEGQRMGIFAAAGVGKSTLLGMLVRHAQVDINVVALIGERGREVREFIEQSLGPEGIAKTIMVVATSDRPAMERVKAAYVATAIAEYFRDQGQRVLLLMDSITRFARAQREIGLAAGEAPTRRGFPASVFALLPKLLERVGQSGKGSITAFYTVLVEGDDMNEPIADEVRSLLDGHLVLSRDLAAAHHYPAIDILASLSRIMPAVTEPEHRQAAARVRELLAKYQDIELLVRIGEYQKGADPLADEALAKIAEIRELLQQELESCTEFAETIAHLNRLSAA